MCCRQCIVRCAQYIPGPKHWAHVLIKCDRELLPPPGRRFYAFIADSGRTFKEGRKECEAKERRKECEEDSGSLFNRARENE
jgi:hypothetical protein